MINYLEYLNLPSKIAVAIVALYLVTNIVGELLEFKGKVVPEYVKIRKFFRRKKQEKDEMKKTLAEVKQLLGDVNNHYSADNINKRDGWMQWVNNRAVVYDDSIKEITNTLAGVADALRCNTKMTEEMFVENSRDRIIDFATKCGNDDAVVSREEFNRIFKVYKKYEDFLAEHDMTNGEIDIAYHIIVESYETHMRNHSFIEDVRGYKTGE